MTQQDLDIAVASATGEDISAIRQFGFSFVDPFETDFDPEPNQLPPQMVDWDSDFAHGATINPFQFE